MNPTKKTCCDCNEEKDKRKDFYLTICRKTAKKTYRAYTRRCKNCHNKYAAKNLLSDRPQFLLSRYRAVDRRTKRENNLTKIIVRDLISKPCHYCKSINISMGLDRVNNLLGHTIENVVPCCVRCNTTRGNMPIKAWIIIAKAMKEATQIGAFGDWIGMSSSKGKYPVR